MPRITHRTSQKQANLVFSWCFWRQQARFSSATAPSPYLNTARSAARREIAPGIPMRNACVHKIKNIFIALSLLMVLSFSLAPVAASAQVSELKCGVNAGATGSDSGNSCPKAPDNPVTLHDIVARVINVISSLIAVVAVIMIMIAGFRYITSGGDSTKVGNAKNTILNAVIGLVIAIFAQVIVKFVLAKAQK